MKKTLFALFFITVIFSSLKSQAEDIIIPLIFKPSILEEGTSRNLSDAQIEELLPWAKDSKVFLVELLDSIDDLNIASKNEKLLAGIKTVVSESAPVSSELLMRYTLNRGLAIYDILNKETNKDAIGVADVKLRVLNSTIAMAIKYYDVDVDSLSQKSKITFADFGKDYYNFLAELNKSIFDASAQYAIQRTTLEWLQWDLYRDSNNTKYAARIVKINNALKKFPAQRVSDLQSIAYLKDMRKLAVELKFKKNDDSLSLKTILPIGDSVIYLEHMNNKFARVEKISDNDDSYTIKYSNGEELKNVAIEDLAITSGCGPKYCVKDKLIIDRAFEVTVIAIKHDGTYVYRYDDDAIKHRAIEATDNVSRLMYQ
jgi:hypothetical protein